MDITSSAPQLASSNSMSSPNQPQDAKESQALKAYKMLAEIPFITSATFLKTAGKRNDIKTISLNLSTRDHVSEQKVSLNRILTVQIREKPQDTQVLSITPPTVTPNPTSNVISNFYSPSGESQAILRERERAWPDKKGGKARVVEIWKGSKCELRLEVNDYHGAFASDDTFGSFAFNQEETAICYSAEAHPPKSVVGDGPESQAAFDFVSPLGEKFGSRLRPAVFLLNFGSKSQDSDFTPTLFQLSPPEDQSSLYLGQGVFSPDGKRIFLTGYDAIKDGRRLGIIYCTNRPAGIYSIKLPSRDQKAEKDKIFEIWRPQGKDDFKRLSQRGVSARSPRVGKGYLVWLGNEEGGAHNDCASIYGLKFSQSSTSPSMEDADELLSKYQKPSKTGFAGVYLDQLPKEPFNANERSETELIFTTILGCVRVATVLNLSSKAVEVLSMIPNPSSFLRPWSDNVLAVEDGLVLASRSDPKCPPRMVLTKLSGLQRKDLWWHSLYEAEEDWKGEAGEIGETLLRTLGKVDSSILVDIDGADPLVHAIVIQPANKSLTPKRTILLPHGGPHGSSTYDFSPSVAAFALAGYNVVLPNYSGSLGLGQEFAHSLLGKAGTLDVADCLAVVKLLVDMSIADEDELVLSGGSHGGFIVAHLVGQYPDMFRAVTMRNPVIANGEMLATSDIRDWCFSEFSEPFDYSDPPITASESTYLKTQAASPIAHVQKIKANVLILLGLEDKRVPPQQARLLYHALKSKGKNVRMLAFENADHALETVQAEWNGWEASFKQFQEALKNCGTWIS